MLWITIIVVVIGYIIFYDMKRKNKIKRQAAQDCLDEQRKKRNDSK